MSPVRLTEFDSRYLGSKPSECRALLKRLAKGLVQFINDRRPTQVVVKLAEFRIALDYSPEEIWKFMFDLKNVPKWDPGVVEARLTNEPPLERVGATIQTLGQGGKDRGTVRVADFEMYRKLVLVFVEPQNEKGKVKDAKLTYVFEPMDKQTILTRVVEAEPVGFWRLLSPLISRAVEKDGQQEAANIRSLFPTKRLT